MRQPEQRWLDALRSMDRHLLYEWCSRICRWVVIREDPFERDGSGRPKRYTVHVVQNQDGSYRDFDARVLQHLKECDLQQYETKDALFASLAATETEHDQEIEKNWQALCHEVAKDIVNYHPVRYGYR